MNYEQQINELVKRMNQLEVQNQRLLNDNNQLKAALAIQPKSQHSVKNREIATAIPRKKYDYLFGFDVNPKTGEKRTADWARKNSNFTNLYRSLLTVLKPVGKATNGQKNKFLIKSPNLYELDNEEFEIIKSAIIDIVDVLFLEKMRLDGNMVDMREAFENEDMQRVFLKYLWNNLPEINGGDSE